MKKLRKLPFDLQLFAEGEGNPNPQAETGTPQGEPSGTPQPKTYSEEEYKKIKQAFDNSASELANLKKQLKAKQTDEEKQAQAQAEKETEFENMRKELTSIKTKSQLLKVFEEKDADTLTQCIVDNDTTKLLENLVSIITANVAKIKEEAKKEFMQSAHIPGSSAGSDDNSFGKQMALAAKKQQPKAKAWGQFKNE